MAAGDVDILMQRLRSLVAAPWTKELSDGQLLELFAATHDQVAFEALMRRHGRLVHGDCRRLLGPGPDADDAYQAAFLVLARKAASIRRQASVASWLYGVAYRVARDLKAKVARRTRHERGACELENIAETTPMSSDPAEQASLRKFGSHIGLRGAASSQEKPRGAGALPSGRAQRGGRGQAIGLSAADAEKPAGTGT